MNRQTIVLALIIAFALGGWSGDGVKPTPKPDRPVLKFISQAARWGLWLLVVGEPAPEPQYTRAAPTDDHIDHQRSL
jgi:hypothetical protein